MLAVPFILFSQVMPSMETCVRNLGALSVGRALARPLAFPARRTLQGSRRKVAAECRQPSSSTAPKAASMQSQSLAVLVSAICPLVYILPAQAAAQSSASLTTELTVPLIFSALLGGLVFGVFNDSSTRRILEDNVKGVKCGPPCNCSWALCSL